MFTVKFKRKIQKVYVHYHLIIEYMGTTFGKEYMKMIEDGGGIGLGDHFLFYKFIERITER